MAESPIDQVTIYYNPRCSKCRQTLKLLQDQGIEPQVVEYLTDPPDAMTLSKILDLLKMQPQQLIRQKEYRELNLPPTEDHRQLIEQMIANPQIIQRPIVTSGNQARVGRPPEVVLEIL